MGWGGEGHEVARRGRPSEGRERVWMEEDRFGKNQAVKQERAHGLQAEARRHGDSDGGVRHVCDVCV